MEKSWATEKGGIKKTTEEKQWIDGGSDEIDDGGSVLIKHVGDI